MKGLVFNIQKYSVHDGPGIRTVVFLKGCPLRCRWCSNPESQSSLVEISYEPGSCIGGECLLCQSVCAQRAIFYPGVGSVALQWDRCSGCGKCAAICPSKAIDYFGKAYSVEEIIQIAEEDCCFYNHSGGGLTLSGGEPLLQWEFSREIFKKAKEYCIHTAIETSGYASWEALKGVVAYCDYIQYDIKSLNEQKHRANTGVSNVCILDNFAKLMEAFPDRPVRVRTPIVPGFNDSDEEIRAIRDFILSFQNPHCEYELLQYHRFGEAKYRQLGRSYEMGEAILSDERFEGWKKYQIIRKEKENADH